MLYIIQYTNTFWSFSQYHRLGTPSNHAYICHSYGSRLRRQWLVHTEASQHRSTFSFAIYR